MSKTETTFTNTGSYPPEEEAICGTLIREIGKYNAWIDKVAAWDALMQVRIQARLMREERDHLAGTKNLGQEGVQNVKA